MKAIELFLAASIVLILLFFNPLFAQADPSADCLGYYNFNDPNSKIIHEHKVNGGNCIGYAIAYTQQSAIGPILGNAKDIIINEVYAKKYWLEWGFYTKTDFNGGANLNDILIWDTNPDNMALRHAAVVTSTGIGEIHISYMDAARPGGPYSGVLRSTENYADPAFGTPDYIVRFNSATYGYAITVGTSFNNCAFKIDTNPYSPGIASKEVTIGISRGPHT